MLIIHKLLKSSHFRLIIFSIALAGVQLFEVSIDHSYNNESLLQSWDLIFWVSAVLAVPVVWVGVFKIRLVAPVISLSMILLLPTHLVMNFYGWAEVFTGGMQITTLYLLLFRLLMLYLFVYLLIHSTRMIFDKGHGWMQDSRLSGQDVRGLLLISCLLFIRVGYVMSFTIIGSERS